ncbi:HET-domain-containing protein [Leucogyrophana mollusca]|uniref:HET-domain-containing protein n=1 Tax=Leucogyrophana mollusca TaxID=85980 RepID=A0ACB8BJ55_9AGAM|nr:HET-domain-containing protein [Leucogyrophana mollusca]
MPYSLISHRWGQEEVSFRDINKRSAAKFKGYRKIEQGCAQAFQDGHRYLWVDTCCIDKSSSAELSEAINSMYRWYEDAQVCYAYLEDVNSDEDPAAASSTFRRSIWFKRGWTLQELIAPTVVIFFGKDWVEIGSKRSLVSVLVEITGVDKEVLLKDNRHTVMHVSAAKKMAWAAQRETTRVEDRAYSLMGLFGVHMPLIYGEEENAFVRLQSEIIRMSTDQSIFAWKLSSLESALFKPSFDSSFENPGRLPLLAPSPNGFRHSTNIRNISSAQLMRTLGLTFTETSPQPHFTIINSGIQISLPIKEVAGFYLAALTCCASGVLLGILLQRDEDGSFRRVLLHILEEIRLPQDGFSVRDILVRPSGIHPIQHARMLMADLNAPRSVKVRVGHVVEQGFVQVECWPRSINIGRLGFTWSQDFADYGDPEKDGVADLIRQIRCYGVLYRNPTTREEFLVIVGHPRSPRRLSIHIHTCPRLGAEGGMREPQTLVKDFTSFAETQYSFEEYLGDCPDWVSMPLGEGKRVTASGRGGNDSTLVLTISVRDVSRKRADEGTQIGRKFIATRIRRVLTRTK